MFSFIHSGIAWIEFLNNNDNFGDILTHLREGDMKGAQLLWLRYEVQWRIYIIIAGQIFVIQPRTWLLVIIVSSQGQITAEFDKCKLEAVLGAIPEDLPSKDLCPWFKTVFVPFVRRVNPSGQVESKIRT